MTKIQLTLNSPPDGMNASQLFDDKEHLSNWIAENFKKLGEISIDAENLTCSDGEIGLVDIAEPEPEIPEEDI